MAEQTEREEIKDETHELEDEENEDVDEEGLKRNHLLPHRVKKILM